MLIMLLLVTVRPAAADQVRDAEQPVLRALNAAGAWRLSEGAGVTVALLDSGVGAGVPDLSGSVTAGPDLTAGVNPPGYQPPNLHGTYMASLIAGHGHGPGGNDGVVGIAPRARILSVRVLLEGSEPGFPYFQQNARYDDTLARGIRYAADHHASVINLSLGGPETTVQERAALAYAVSRGVVVVAAAGNDGSGSSRNTSFSYPGSYPGLITVAAVTAQGQHAYFSDHNASVVVSAPGVDVVGAAPDDQYLIGAGTSQATALVSGIAALIRARFPGLAPALVRQAIIESTIHRPRGGYDTLTGFGEVNAASAVREAATLAGGRAAPGLAGTTTLGGAAARGPVEIISRSGPLLAGCAAATVAGLLGCVFLIIAARRASRSTRGQMPGRVVGTAWPGPPRPAFPEPFPGPPGPVFPEPFPGPPGPVFPDRPGAPDPPAL
jgi:type VII secretion-associated serine protease mycosin